MTLKVDKSEVRHIGRKIAPTHKIMSTADTGTQERSRNHCREFPQHISSMVSVGKIAEKGNKMIKNIVTTLA